MCVCIGEPALLRCMSCLPHASLNFCTPHLTFELYMLGSKGCERMPLVSSCEINKENRIKLFKNIWFSPEIYKKDDFKNYIVLIKKTYHMAWASIIYTHKNTMCRIHVTSFLNLRGRKLGATY